MGFSGQIPSDSVASFSRILRPARLRFCGSQYNAETFRLQLAILNIEQSMSGVGNCFDNAPMESFWARMKTEIRAEMMFDDLRHARSVVYRWVHLFYNRKRLHSGIGHLTPVEFEEQLSSQSTDRIHCQ
jgi:transposase InsO family protein